MYFYNRILRKRLMVMTKLINYRQLTIVLILHLLEKAVSLSTEMMGFIQLFMIIYFHTDRTTQGKRNRMVKRELSQWETRRRKS